MNREELLNAAEVMRRAAEGEPVQWKEKDQKLRETEWKSCGALAEFALFDWERSIYRITPKPREVWINIYKDGSMYIYNDPKRCRGTRSDILAQAVHFREVLP